MNNSKFLKLDAIEKFAKKLEAEKAKMYNVNISTEDKYWSLAREKKIRKMLIASEAEYQRILHSA